MKHLIKWDTLPEFLQKLAEDLEKTPIISLEIEKDVELIIRNIRSIGNKKK